MKLNVWRRKWGVRFWFELGPVWLEVRLSNVMGNVARYGIRGVEIGAWW